MDEEWKRKLDHESGKNISQQNSLGEGDREVTHMLTRQDQAGHFNTCLHTALLISYVYTLDFSQCHSDIARPNIYIFLTPFFYFRFVCIVVNRKIFLHYWS